MDIKTQINRIGGLIKKYRYVVIILIIGVVLMMLPTGSDTKISDSNDSTSHQPIEKTTEQKLAEILSQIHGAGNVAVMLTASAGEEILYQIDSQTDEQSDATDISINTVIITDKDRNETGLIRQVNPPVYLGAIVVCEGGDNPTIQLAIKEAVAKITGLGTHNISVLKMK